MTKEEAITLVENLIKKQGEQMNQDLIVDVKNIRDAGTHWIVPFDTREYLETGNTVFSLIGNGPLYISKTSGKHDNDFDPDIIFPME